jgi:[ribosomal protein S5]-alanine N-acetyltransferase
MQPLLALLPAAKDNTLIRTMQSADLEGFHSYRCDDELARYQGWSPMTQKEAHAFVQEMTAATALRPGSWIQLTIADATSNRILGDVGLYLDPDKSAAEIGFTLSRAAQGRGHAARAVGLSLSLVFAASSVPFVRAVTDARNASSIRVLEQTRFAKSSTQQTMFKGEPCTELVYAFRRTDA